MRYVKNITDVGHLRDDQLDSLTGPDKVKLAAETEGKTPMEIADFYAAAWLEDEALLNILPVDVMPKATDHVPEMIDMTAQLLDKCPAYEVDCTIYYYDVSEFAGTGSSRVRGSRRGAPGTASRSSPTSGLRALEACRT